MLSCCRLNWLQFTHPKYGFIERLSSVLCWKYSLPAQADRGGGGWIGAKLDDSKKKIVLLQYLSLYACTDPLISYKA
jgi:hypothetical protein